MILNDIYINPTKIEMVRTIKETNLGNGIEVRAEIETDKLKIRFVCCKEKYLRILKNLELRRGLVTEVALMVTEIKQPPKRKWWHK